MSFSFFSRDLDYVIQSGPITASISSCQILIRLPHHETSINPIATKNPTSRTKNFILHPAPTIRLTLISASPTQLSSFAMASTLFTTPIPKSNLLSTSFHGLRPLKPTDPSFQTRAISIKCTRSTRKPGTVRSELNPSLVISLSTGLSLFLGRFVFFNFQRENVAKQLPKQNGVTHFEAGDTRAKEFASLLKSNDPVGFNIVDVLMWGTMGHVVAYYILATSSNGYDPSFFG